MAFSSRRHYPPFFPNYREEDLGGSRRQEVLRLANDVFIALGGDDTQSVTLLFLAEMESTPSAFQDHRQRHQRHRSNLRFTAVMIATEAIDRIHTTADLHNRVIVVEAMGRAMPAGSLTLAGRGRRPRRPRPRKEIDIDHVCALLVLQLRSRQALRRCCRCRRLPPSRGWPGHWLQGSRFIWPRASLRIGEAPASSPSRRRQDLKLRSVNPVTPSAAGYPPPTTVSLVSAYGLHDKWCTTRNGAIAVLKGLDVTDITIKEAIATNRCSISASSMGLAILKQKV